jgi:hypothetical protein
MVLEIKVLWRIVGNIYTYKKVNSRIRSWYFYVVCNKSLEKYDFVSNALMSILFCIGMERGLSLQGKNVE